MMPQRKLQCLTLKAEVRQCQQKLEQCAEGERNRVAQLGQVDRFSLREQNAAAVADHRDRVAQNKTQQLAARERERISHLGDAEPQCCPRAY